MSISNRQAGFSMVELMIGVTIGLVLLLGVTQVYQGYKQSYNQQEGMAELQETARFAMQFLTRSVRQAGYRHSPEGSADGVFNTTDGPGGSTLAVEGTEGGANPDTLIVRYQGSDDDLVIDCLGAAVKTDEDDDGNAELFERRMVVNTFSVDTADNELECLRQIDDDPTVNAVFELGAAASPQPLLSGVTDMQVLYGVDDTPGDALIQVNRYLAADGIGGVGEPGWNSVVSVQIALTVQSIATLGGADGSAAPLQRTIKTVVDLRNRIS